MWHLSFWAWLPVLSVVVSGPSPFLVADVIKFCLRESAGNTITASSVASLCVDTVGLTGRLLTGLTVALEHTLDSSSVPLLVISRWALVSIVLWMKAAEGGETVYT